MKPQARLDHASGKGHRHPKNESMLS